eukprot:m.16316 g.16316  ORF g.16316 m.16316 type:complete len:356 (-) comp3372_c0_seq1:129-1196(-)
MSGQTKLHVLAQEGDTRLLTQALRNADPNVTDSDGMTPLHFAAWYGHPACCQALLAANANIDAFDHDGASALHAAAYNGQLGCVIMLVESGASAFSADNENHTPKDAAINEKHGDIVAYLRAVEEDQRREAEVERCSKLLADAQQHAKVFKPELTQAIKQAKKRQAQIAKETKKLRKETLKLKRLRTKKKGSNPDLNPPPTAPTTTTAPPGRKSRAASTSSLQRPKSRLSSTSSTQADETTSSRHTSPDRARVVSGSGADTSGSVRPEARPLPAVPPVSPEVAAEMVLAEFEADESSGGGLIAFLDSLDLKEFARLVTKDVSSLEELQKKSMADLQRMGLPTGARKKIVAALHPK